MFTMWDMLSWKDLSSQSQVLLCGLLCASQVSRRLKVVFAGGSKLHYCHSKDHKVASLEVRGRWLRLSTGICHRDQLLKNVTFFAPSHNTFFSPLVQLVACQLSIIYRCVGGGHSKYTPDHTLQIQGGGKFIAPNGIQSSVFRFCHWLRRAHLLLQSPKNILCYITNIARGTTDPGYWLHILSESFS